MAKLKGGDHKTELNFKVGCDHCLTEVARVSLVVVATSPEILSRLSDRVQPSGYTLENQVCDSCKEKLAAARLAALRPYEEANPRPEWSSDEYKSVWAPEYTRLGTEAEAAAIAEIKEAAGVA